MSAIDDFLFSTLVANHPNPRIASRVIAVAEASAIHSAADSVRLDRDAAASGQSPDYRRGMTRAIEVLRLLADQRNAPEREKSSPAGAEAAPGLTARQARLLDAIRTWGGEWTTSRALHLFALTDPDTVTRAAARRDLEQLHSAGHLVLVDELDNRHFTLALRKDRS